MRDLERPSRANARSRRVMVSTSNPVATAEALAILQSGGNGGDCFALIAPGGGPDVVAYNGSGPGRPWQGEAQRPTLPARFGFPCV